MTTVSVCNKIRTLFTRFVACVACSNCCQDDEVINASAIIHANSHGKLQIIETLVITPVPEINDTAITKLSK